MAETLRFMSVSETEKTFCLCFHFDHLMQGKHFKKGANAIQIIKQLRRLADGLEAEINDGMKKDNGK